MKVRNVALYSAAFLFGIVQAVHAVTGTQLNSVADLATATDPNVNVNSYRTGANDGAGGTFVRFSSPSCGADNGVAVGVTSTTVNFNPAFATVPVCVSSPNAGTTTARITTLDASHIVITYSGSVASATDYILCTAN